MIRQYQLSISVQLKFLLGQKIQSDFRTGYVQSLHFQNREKNERKKKLRIFNFLGGWRILEKKKLLTNEI